MRKPILYVKWKRNERKKRNKKQSQIKVCNGVRYEMSLLILSQFCQIVTIHCCIDLNSLRWLILFVFSRKKVRIFLYFCWKMYFVAYIPSCKKRVVIPIHWVCGVNMISACNSGINRNKVYLIFFSPNIADSEDFLKPISQHFNEHNRACYFAKLLKCYGKYYYKVHFISVNEFIQ